MNAMIAWPTYSLSSPKPDGAIMSLDPALLAILACPEDKGPLYYLEDEGVLFNPRLARTYEIRDNIPVMLVEESTSLGDDDAARLSAIIAERGIAPTFDA
jgi:uncharacterized protein YbaR (Trm112 family)